jgi:hypothetical protein
MPSASSGSDSEGAEVDGGVHNANDTAMSDGATATDRETGDRQSTGDVEALFGCALNYHPTGTRRHTGLMQMLDVQRRQRR